MKLLHSFLKDLRLAYRTYYVYMELGIALLVVAVLIFVMPENFNRSAKAWLHVADASLPAAAIEKALGEDGLDIGRVATGAELRERLEEDRSAIGFDLRLEDGRPKLVFVLQGYESASLRASLETSVEAAFSRALPGYRASTVTTTLRSRDATLSDRVNVLPVFLAMNAAFMGLFIIASYIFLDKSEGAVKAFAVSPAKVWHYLAGKMGVVAVTGLASGLLTVALVAGADAQYPLFVVLLLATNAFGSAVGLFIASFFDDLSSAMGWVFGSVALLGLAAVSYYLPSFSPLAVRLLPSYPMLFAFRETLLAAPDAGLVWANVGGYSAGALVLFLLAERQYRRRMTA